MLLGNGLLEAVDQNPLLTASKRLQVSEGLLLTVHVILKFGTSCVCSSNCWWGFSVCFNSVFIVIFLIAIWNYLGYLVELQDNASVSYKISPGPNFNTKIKKWMWSIKKEPLERLFKMRELVLVAFFHTSALCPSCKLVKSKITCHSCKLSIKINVPQEIERGKKGI